MTVLIDAELKADYHQLILVDRACNHDFGESWDAANERHAEEFIAACGSSGDWRASRAVYCWGR